MSDSSKMLLGGGRLTINNVDVGYLLDNAELNVTKTYEDHYTGIPLTLSGRTPKQETMTLSASLAQITPENICRALGIAVPSGSGTLTLNIGVAGSSPAVLSNVVFVGKRLDGEDVRIEMPRAYSEGDLKLTFSQSLSAYMSIGLKLIAFKNQSSDVLGSIKLKA